MASKCEADQCQPVDMDDICPKTGKRHVPDFKTATVTVDGREAYVDVNCRDCGRSGCIGTAKTLSADIQW